MDLRGTYEFARLAAARRTLAAMDHEQDVDPDELIPRFFESAVALDMLSYVVEWDYPPDVADALEVVINWLREENAGHSRLLAEGGLPRVEGNEDGSNRDVPPFDNDPRTDAEIKQEVYNRLSDPEHDDDHPADGEE